MNLFENGRRFAQAIRCCPPSGKRLPVVQVLMVGASGEFVSVMGKVDTGAFRTMLSFATAGALGIDDPTSSAEPKRTARTATNAPLDYYVHRVAVRIADSSGETIEHLSQLRLGVNLGLIDRLDAATVNQLFILTLPAHLQKIEGKALEPKQRDIVRAQFIRETLGST